MLTRREKKENVQRRGAMMENCVRGENYLFFLYQPRIEHGFCYRCHKHSRHFTATGIGVIQDGQRQLGDAGI